MIGIVVSKFNSLITERLLEGAKSVLNEEGLEYEVFFVNGSFEIPQKINLIIENDNNRKYRGFIALGCIIKGETRHDEYIANAVSYGIMKISIEKNVPITFGIITANSLEQALDRAGGKFGNKGEESAKALIQLMK